MSATNLRQSDLPDAIQRLCQEFRRRWVSADRMRIEDIVVQEPAALRPALLRELLAIERELRTSAGDPMLAAEARQRFGELGSWALDVIEETLQATTSACSAAEDTCTLKMEAAPPASVLPMSVGKFRILRELGGGGMGLVYLAEDPDGKRQVAVKVMRPIYAANAAARQRFLREARLAMMIEHDHVVSVYQVEENNVNPFLVMPALRGESLHDRLEREPLASLELILKVGREVALGLAAAHDRGLVHRDVKPANTWLEGDPASPDFGVQVRRVKVLDFGIARAISSTEGLSLTDMVIGTPQYMAPEQADGRSVDARADLFSLGAMLYQMTAGRPPFAGPSIAAVLTAIATHQPPPVVAINPAAPIGLSNLIERLLAKDPSHRPQSAAEVASVLGSIERHKPKRISPAWRSWRVAIAAALVLLGVAIGFVAFLNLAAKDPLAAASAYPSAMNPLPLKHKVRVDLLIERNARLVRLNRPGALPLQASDGFAIEAAVEPAAYLYVVWIDPEHDVTPVYPWDAKTGWGSRPDQEQPIRQLRLPTPGELFYAPKAKPGVATIVAFACSKPLVASDEQVRAWFEDLPELTLHPSEEQAVVWFDNYRQVEDDDARRGTFSIKSATDPFVVLHGKMSRLLEGHAEGQSAVSFARTGRK